MSPSRTSRRRLRSDRITARLVATALFALAPVAANASDRLVEHQIKPSAIDPGVRQFDEPSIALTDPDLPADAPLAIFMPGTGGKPSNALGLLGVIAAQGYRVISLEYDDDPAVSQVCPRDPDPACSTTFREMRVYGTGTSRQVSNPTAEAIVPRLVAALKALDRAAPGEHWGAYLDGDQPRWERIVVSGLSQGAGMAAFIAKQHAVRRVVLFSSPWDSTGSDHHPAPWLSLPSATPPERWQAEYNKRERTAGLITAAYGALAIPPANVRVFDLDLPPGVSPDKPNPYHGITVRDPRYAAQWRAMYGKGSDAP